MVDLVTNNLTKKEIEAYIKRLTTSTADRPALIPDLADVSMRQRKAELIQDINARIANHNRSLRDRQLDELDGDSSSAGSAPRAPALDLGETRTRTLRWLGIAAAVLFLVWMLMLAL